MMSSEAEHRDPPPVPPEGADEPSEPESRVVRRRDPAELTAEERSFMARYRADMPPHHDSSWG